MEGTITEKAIKKARNTASDRWNARTGDVFLLGGPFGSDTDRVGAAVFKVCSCGLSNSDGRFNGQDRLRCLFEILTTDKIFDINHSPFNSLYFFSFIFHSDFGYTHPILQNSEKNVNKHYAQNTAI